MAGKFFIDLGHVVDRDGRQVAASMRTEQWGTETEYVIALGDSKSGGYLLSVLFGYVLRDGLSDFEILRDDCPLVQHAIPAGEMRALVRRLMGRPHKVGPAQMTVHLGPQVILVEPRAADLECPF